MLNLAMPKTELNPKIKAPKTVFKTFKGLEGLHKLFAAAATHPGRQDYGSAKMVLAARRRGPKQAPRQRLAPAAMGGNWQGVEYLTCAEHDFCTRMSMYDLPGYDRKWLYKRAVEVLFAERLAARKSA